MQQHNGGSLKISVHSVCVDRINMLYGIEQVERISSFESAGWRDHIWKRGWLTSAEWRRVNARQSRAIDPELLLRNLHSEYGSSWRNRIDHDIWTVSFGLATMRPAMRQIRREFDEYRPR
jgi:hypothetical protein